MLTNGSRFRRGAWLAVSLLLGSLAGCGKPDASRLPPPPEVAVVTVEPHEVPLNYEFSGEVVPYHRVEVRARVEGVIEARPFTEGMDVTQGQVLYRLDRVRYLAAFEGATARFDNAKATLERLEPLVAQHAVAQQDVDNARAAFAAAQAALDQARKDLNDTEVRAEIAGRVGRTLLEVGARVTGPADRLTTIDQLDQVYVTFFPSMDQMLQWRADPRSRALIQPGGQLVVEVILSDGSKLPRTGRLDFVAPSLDAATGTEECRAVVANGDRVLVPGQFVRVRLVGFVRAGAFAVPMRAVQSSLGRQFVYVVGPGDTVMARYIQPGPWSGDSWIIEQGLSAGDRVIVDGVQKVGPGRPVRPVALSDSTAASGGR